MSSVTQTGRGEGGRVLQVTPAGAFFAVSVTEGSSLRDFLFALLARPLRWSDSEAGTTPTSDQEVAAQLLKLEWAEEVQADTEAFSIESLEKVLPPILACLSSERRALLADAQGLQIAVAGFDLRQAQRLAALSSEAVALGLRHRDLTMETHVQTSAAWALVDAAGNSQLGVWPLFIGGSRFALVVGGRPLFARAPFLSLIRILVRRAASEQVQAAPSAVQKKDEIVSISITT